MPAVNTPQFSWVRSKLPRHPQPVPPIYQPEVAARGVLYAADHPARRQYWVGASTAATLAGQQVRRPRLLDRYLARTGYDSQQTGTRRGRTGPGNLRQPADGSGGHDHGAHGDLRRPVASPQRATMGGHAPAGHGRPGRGRGGGRRRRPGEPAGRPPMRDTAGPAAPGLLAAARACYGGLLLGAPRRMIGVCAPGPAGPRALAVARVLGGRHLLQAVLTAGVLSAQNPARRGLARHGPAGWLRG